MGEKIKITDLFPAGEAQALAKIEGLFKNNEKDREERKKKLKEDIDELRRKYEPEISSSGNNLMETSQVAVNGESGEGENGVFQATVLN